MTSLTHDEVQLLLVKLKSIAETELYESFESITNSYTEIQRLLKLKNQSIKNLKELIFGVKTERREKEPVPPDGSFDDSASEGDPVKENNNTEEGSDDSKVIHPTPPKPETKRTRNGGKLGAKDYTGAKTKHFCHPDLKAGDLCPTCNKAKLYQRKPLSFIEITGTPPLDATINKYESLRCGLCGEIFNAPRPDEPQVKYDERAIAMMAILRYGMGMPCYRLERLQSSFGIPLPASTQWKVIKDSLFIFKLIRETLITSAGSAELIHIDDTPAKILSEMGKRLKAKGERDDKRKGLFTTGMIARSEDKYDIALYFTGHDHAGENLIKVLSERPEDLPKPILMCDALSRNTPKNVAVILARCLAHARRKFYEIKDDFPEECDVILDIIGHLYTIDRWIKDDEMSMENRLKHHQLFSAQAVDELYEYLEKLSLMEHIEPGTTLAQSIRYTMNHWEGLTLFLRKVGAPMDNNVCEQAIKVAILSRKNSYFYRSEDGAEAGDIFMSIIQTCAINKVSYFDYLVALQENQDEVIANPEKWLPWNCPKLVSAKNS
jgi:hypothetical protein